MQNKSLHITIPIIGIMESPYSCKILPMFNAKRNKYKTNLHVQCTCKDVVRIGMQDKFNLFSF